MRITTLGGISFGSTGTAYGSSGQVLTSGGDASPTWTTPTTGTVTGSGAATQVAFWDGTSSLSGNSDLWWDNTNGHLGIGDTTPGSRLKVTSGTSETSIYTVDINHVRNDANVSTMAMRLNVDLSGADTTTADRTNYGLFVDTDSSANGDATHEHRIRGVGSFVNFTGFTDVAQGGHFLAESNYLLGKTAQLVGVYAQAAHDTSSTDGGVSNMYGVFGTSSIQDLGDVDNAFGGYFSVSISTNRGNANVGVTKGVEGHIDIDKAETITYGEMMAVSGIIDNNEGTVPTFGNQYLFKGDYQGTKGGNAYGIYCEGDKHYFDGNVGIGTTSPGYPFSLESATTGLISRIYNTNADGQGLLIRAGATTSATRVFQAASSDDTKIMTVNSNGNVGIGTTSPSNKLEVVGSNAVRIHDGTDQGSIFFRGDRDDVYIKESNYQLLFGAPSGMVFELDTNLNDNDVFNVMHRGSSRMYINGASGNVGIGTTSPSTRLEVSASATTSVDIAHFSNSNGSAKIKHSLDGVGSGQISIFDASNNEDIRLSTQSDSWFNAGNVGIGTTNPGYKLHVDDNTAYGGIFIEGDNAPGLTIRDNSGTSESKIYVQSTSGSQGNLRISSDNNNTATTPTIEFLIGNSHKMRILDNGNVGIGATAPLAKLQVGLSTSNSGSTVAMFGAANSGILSALSLVNTLGNAVTGQGVALDFHVNSSYSPTGRIATVSESTGTPAALAFYTYNGGLIEKMRINSAGNVGIGTTSPSAKLDIHHFTSGGNDDLLNIGLDATNPTRAKIYTENYDGNFGLWDSGSTQQVKVSSDGNSYFNGGNVGIGTTSPSSKLNISSASYNDHITLTRASDELGISVSGGQLTFEGGVSPFNNNDKDLGRSDKHWREAFVYSLRSGGALQFKTNGNNERMRITSAGNVGIGVTSPIGKLNVSKDSTTDGLSQAITVSSSSVSTKRMNLGYVPGSNYAFIDVINYAISNTNQALSLQPNGGNVGIGTTSPIAPLHITGPAPIATQPVIKVERTSPVVDYQDTNPTNGYLFFTERFSNLAGSVISTRKVMQNPGGEGVYTNFNHGLLTGQGTEHNQRNNSFHWKIDNSTNEVLTINTSGNVGIGTTSPSYKLDVSGNGRFTSTVTAANFILSSDERLKENIKKACDNRIKADWKTFELKTDKGQKRYGVIAQELEKTNPEFVREDTQGFKSVAYIDLLIAKIAELEARLEKAGI